MWQNSRQWMLTGDDISPVQRNTNLVVKLLGMENRRLFSSMYEPLPYQVTSTWSTSPPLNCITSAHTLTIPTNVIGSCIVELLPMGILPRPSTYLLPSLSSPRTEKACVSCLSIISCRTVKTCSTALNSVATELLECKIEFDGCPIDGPIIYCETVQNCIRSILNSDW